MRHLLFLFAASLGAQTISNIRVDHKTYSQVRIQWNTSTDTFNDYVLWGNTGALTVGSCTPPGCNQTVQSGESTFSGTKHGVTFTVPPSSVAGTVYFKVCTSAGAVCSTEQSFATDAEPLTQVDDPLTFTPYAMPSMPTTWDKTYFVDAANCNAGNTGTDTGGWQWCLDQAFASTLPSNNNILIKAPSGLVCDFATSTYRLAVDVRTGGTIPSIWIVSSAWIDSPNTVPPAGVSVNEYWPESIFATASPSCSTCPAILLAEGRSTQVGKVYWRGIQLARKTQVPGEFQTITAATNTTPINITVTAHGRSTGDYVQTYDCVGNTGANMPTTTVTVVDANTLTLANSVGNGTLSGTCKMRFSNPFETRAFITADDNVYVGLGNATNIRENGFDQMRIIGDQGRGMSSSTGNALNYINQVEVKNSYIEGTYGWRHFGDPLALNFPTGVALDITGSGNVSLDNNRVRWPGISIFGQTAGTGTALNILVRRQQMKWPTKWMVNPDGGRPAETEPSNGFHGFVRQQIEFKSGNKIRLIGNTIEDSWATNGQTGALGGPQIVISPRASDSGVVEDSNSLTRDVYIGYNWVRRSPGCWGVQGADLENQIHDVAGVRRVLIEHNLCTEIDARTWGSVQGSVVQGTSLYLGEAISDLMVRNNTFSDVKGPGAALVYWYNNRAARVRFENNVFAGANSANQFKWASSGISGTIPAFTDLSHTGTSKARFESAVYRGISGTAWGTWTNNLIIPGVADGTSYNTVGGITKATCDTEWPSTSTVCLGFTGDTPNQRLDLLKFFNRTGSTMDSYRLRHDAPGVSGHPSVSWCATNPTMCLRGTDGRDMGADIDRLIQETGEVRNVRVYKSGASWHVAYTAPDSFACTVEYGTSGTWGSGTRIQDAGGARPRDVTLTGVSTGAYHYRVLCAVQQPFGQWNAF